MDTVPPKPKKIKGATREELLQLSKDDLVDKILKLEAHNAHLKNIISKNLAGDDESERKRKKPFDFSKCQYRRVLLRILYFGWDYQGLVVQEDTTQTIEHHLFHALTKSCLIQSRETSQYHRCGRTDKGVSAFGQVISISLRSTHGEGGDVSKELPYCKILNRLLPNNIKAVAWMPIPSDRPDYSARFDCTARQYKYYFPAGSLSLRAMRCACARLAGSGDYRHLCKMDVGNGVTQFVRDVRRAEILPVDGEGDSPYTMYYLLIEGNAFLWHQIRCIMGVLLLIGQGNESPGVISELLNVEKHPRRPQYNMALDVPLNLFHCSYDLEHTQNWVQDKDELKTVIAQLQGEWTVQNVKATMIRDALQHLEKEHELLKSEMAACDGSASEQDRVMAHTDCLLMGVKPKVYKPLFERPTCSYTMYYLLIEGNAFLWHQIRCIMGVLLLVGQGNESPDAISELLNVEKHPRRPQYNMALDVPLNLFHCSYDLEHTQNWVHDKDELKSVIAQLQGEWTVQNVKATMIRDALQQLEKEYELLKSETAACDGGASEQDRVMAHTDCLLMGVKPKVYKPLFERPTCSSLEERIEHYKKKRKVQTDDLKTEDS